LFSFVLEPLSIGAHACLPPTAVGSASRLAGQNKRDEAATPKSQRAQQQPGRRADQTDKNDRVDQEDERTEKQTDPALAKNSKNKRPRRVEDAKSGQQGQADGLADETGPNIVSLTSDKQSKNGDTTVAEGYVDANLEDMRLQADRVTYNSITTDMLAEGNVIFDQGADQRVTAKRAEINWNSRKGVFWDTTGFTNRTQTGDYVYFTAERVEKTGELTYLLFNAEVTACEDAVPKWHFSAKRAELKMGDRVILHNAVFRVKGLPVFVLPYAWIPASRNERKSGFLIPTTGNSNQKGRTLKFAYYQTLGQSADLTFRSDFYTSRGIGLGGEFRAQTDDQSYMRLGIFTVKDRLFGTPGENQGGTAFVGEGVQHLPYGWLLVGNASLVTSLAFRQVFSDDISQVIDPRRESTFYANNNSGNFSLSFLASNETTRVFRPPTNPQPAPGVAPTPGTDFDIKIRQAPEANFMMYPRRFFSRIPVYFSFDGSVGALKREETVGDDTVLVTPAAVQRLDLQPRVILPLATLAGIAITPTLAFRQTFYSSSINPGVPVFNPDRFTLTPGDPRLDPSRFEFKPGLTLFDRSSFDAVIADKISRRYGELMVDVRPPTLEKIFLNDDGSRRFKHIIEPYITYRVIRGIGQEFNQIIRFDERDAVANTNEFEYAVVNRFFTTSHSSELGRRKRRRSGTPDEMVPVTPKPADKRKGASKADKRSTETQPPAQGPAKAGSKERLDPQTGVTGGVETTSEAEKKRILETGQQSEMSKPGERSDPTVEPKRDPGLAATRGPGSPPDVIAAGTSNEDAPLEAYEFLTLKVAQKYFFDRNFGGALVEGRRNQFYPMNTLTGFTYGGRARSFSPVNVSLRYRPISSVFADVRLDVGSEDKLVRNATVSGGVSGDRIAVSASWNLSRRIKLDDNSFEAGTFPGSQLDTSFQYGDGSRGLYAGTRIGYEFTDRFIGESVSPGRLRNSRSYAGYAWDCCGLQFNYNTFKAGLRNESAFSFTFSLAGLGSFGTDQFSQLGGGRGGRRRGKKNRVDDF
jgi:lipopolysaccharide transport LptD-like protein